MPIIDSIYKRLAVLTTVRENYRTDSSHEFSLVSKLFLFQLVNGFVGPMYIAFVEQEIESVGVDVYFRLIAIFAYSLVAEYLLKSVWAKGKTEIVSNSEKRVEQQASSHSVEFEYILQQSQLPVIRDLFEDYNQLAMTFGYMTCFAAAAPAASCLVALFVHLQGRGDLGKYLYIVQRFAPARAGGIGPWLEVFTFLCYLAIPMNFLVLLVMSDITWSSLLEIFFKVTKQSEKVCDLYARTTMGLAFTVVCLFGVGLCRRFNASGTAAWVTTRQSREKYHAKRRALVAAAKKLS